MAQHRTGWHGLVIGTLFAFCYGQAYAVSIAQTPLAQTTTTQVPPNIYFILDDSGSMNRTYMPDKDGDGHNLGGDTAESAGRCYHWAGYNKQWYDPAVTYAVPVNASGNALSTSPYTYAQSISHHLAIYTQDAAAAYAVRNGYVGTASYTYTDLSTAWSNNTDGGTAYAYVVPAAHRTPSTSSCSDDRDFATIAWSAMTAADKQNYAVWFTYYRTRLMAMKGAVSLAFKSVNTSYRIGFSTISDTGVDEATGSFLKFNALADNDSDGNNHKANFYSKLFAQTAGGSTPLRTALDKAGKIYKGTLLTGSDDPVLYSCQKNFTILSTDGYWNDAFSGIGDQDGSNSGKTQASVDNYQAGVVSSAVSTTVTGTVTSRRAGGSTIYTVTVPSSSVSVSGNVSGTVSGTMTGSISGTASGSKRGTGDVTVGGTFTGTVSGTVTGSSNTSATATVNGVLSGIVPVTGTGTVTLTLTGTVSGRVDGLSGTVSRPAWDELGASDTLADIAYYYYWNDLRTGAGSKSPNNVPPSGTSKTLDDIATWQHMTTFTLGMGSGGNVYFEPNYKNETRRPSGAASGQTTFYDLARGSASWPDPTPTEDNTRIDDLWHAAVNGRGLYFSAQDPSSIQTGLARALQQLSGTTGAASAAATSNLEPVTGDNFAYIASYRTVNWDGQVTASQIDLNTGELSATPTWIAQGLLDAKASASSDTRTIYTYDPTDNGSGGDLLKPFAWGNLTTTEQGYFATSQLTQYASWTAAERTAATGQTLVNYLRGQNGFEANGTNSTQLYRAREHILGDTVHAQPVYVRSPGFAYLDSGYDAFKATHAVATRANMLYVAANDGMVHAFDAASGAERWAYVPPMVLPSLYKLANSNYSDNHQYFVDATPTAGDVYINGGWHTILVGGQGAGGRGFYALDITDPTSPKGLWNFTSSIDADLGLTFGAPIIAKRPSDGKWVVIVAAGYNSDAGLPAGNGKGYLYVLDAANGNVLSKTGVPGIDTGAGLTHLSAWADDAVHDNIVSRVYGGDLNGNLWRFALGTDVAHPDAVSVTKLIGVGKPITVKPELGLVNNHYPAVFFGTGRYLGLPDVGDTSQQAVYAVKDDQSGSTVSVGTLVQQTISTLPGNASERTATDNSVDWDVKNGWYFNLPDDGERVNVDPRLQLGILTIASNVPVNDACSAGGYSWLYMVDMATGSYTSTASEHVVGSKLGNALAVGIAVVMLPDGRVIAIVTQSDNTQKIKGQDGAPGTGTVRRVSWREIVTD